MKSFRQIISEVAQPSSEDELNFKEKHVIDHILDPNAEEDQFTADHIKKFKNRADYADSEDRAVYEDVTLTRRAIPGQEDGDVDGDGDDDATDDQLRYRRHAQIKSKIIDEAKMTPAQIKKREEIVMAMKDNAADLKKKYGKDWESTMYAIATKQAMAESAEQIDEGYEVKKGDSRIINDKNYTSHELHYNGKHVATVYPHTAISQTKRAGSRVASSQKTVVRWGYKFAPGKKPDISASRYDVTTGYSSKDDAMQAAKKDYQKHFGLGEQIDIRESAQPSNGDWEKDSAKVKKSSDPKFVSKMIEKWGSRGGAWLNHPAFTKEVTEALDPVGKEDDDVNNDGKVNSSDAFLKARRKAIAKKLQQEGLTDVVQPAGGDFDSEASHVAYKKKNLKGSDFKGEPLNVAEANAEIPENKIKTKGVSQVNPKAGLRVYAGKTKQSDISETFRPGDVKLIDGSYVNILDEEARLLNSLYESLDEVNRSKMMGIVESSVAGFESIVQFAEDNI